MKSELSKDAEEFALRVLKMYSFLVQRKKEYVLSKQVLRSGTSIGANLAEAEYAQTRPDFITKMHNALKRLRKRGTGFVFSTKAVIFPISSLSAWRRMCGP